MPANILERIGKEWIFFDGGTGTILQQMGLKPGELPETWNLTHQEEIIRLYSRYLEAGSDIFNANTFGANRLKYPDNLEPIIREAVRLGFEARRRTGREDACIALDIGPSGKLLKPMGDLDFEDAVALFGEVVRIGADAGADLVLIETMNDSYEAKAAVLAAKEYSDLPVFITMVFDENGKMLTGGTPESMCAMLEGLHVDALGVNCSLGPKQMLPIARRFLAASSLPVIVNPNAGLPVIRDGKTTYDVDADEFARIMEQIASLGIHGCGGCCGTTPEYIKKTIERVSKLPFQPPLKKYSTVISSFCRTADPERAPLLIGERINPTGKKKFQQALRNRDMEYVLNEGLKQETAGADILDVNLGLPDIDEASMLCEAVQKLQSVTPLPLEIDTADPKALEKALRVYNGKALINSVNGKKAVMEAVFPLVKKYGGVVVGLTLDEDGIPPTADGRLAVAKKICDCAASYGIGRQDLVFDGLAMTVSSDPESALVTLETIRRLKGELGLHTILGVSNISFGLPARELINSCFLSMALADGLSFAIMNPLSDAMMQAYRSFLALTNRDPHFAGFLEAYRDYKSQAAAYGQGQRGAQTPGTGIGKAEAQGSGGQTTGTTGSGGQADGAQSSGTPGAGAQAGGAQSSLAQAILHGMAGQASDAARQSLLLRSPLEVINEEIVPALDIVGKGFEKGTFFLPQLLMSAEAAKSAFEAVKESLSDAPQETKGRLILATVKGDIHDIGKNIVKVMLENYGYEVLDLGKDVDPETILKTARAEGIVLVGLSALMTTTVPSMEETIRLLHREKPDTRIVVGGAVLTQVYADQIGADFYAKDAMATVRYADSVFAKQTGGNV